jgi:hypothetical protein
VRKKRASKRDPNAAPPVEERFDELHARLVNLGFQPGPLGDPAFDAGHAADAETAAEGECGHCGRRGLEAVPYRRESAAYRGLEYECLERCADCGWGFQM